ncbi:hypothetical protein [Actinacidiphila sp. bgisy160]|uniref:hypothetical protein n=1 Tax=Actinacidiphila sp. bgisy160 TaxID=3413796 RepID=UPI003D724984
MFEDDVLKAYAKAREGLYLDPIDRAKLLEWELAIPDPTNPDQVVPREIERIPEVYRDNAIKSLTGALTALERVSHVMDALRRNYPANGGTTDLGITLMRGDRDRVTAAIARAADASVLGVWTSNPNMRPAAELARLEAHDVEFRRSGRAMYSLYADEFRTAEPMQAWVRRVNEQQAGQVRTLPAAQFCKVKIVDPGLPHGQAFIEDYLDGDPDSALHVRDPRMVAWLGAEYQRWWNAALPWDGTERFLPDEDAGTTIRVTDELDLCILLFTEQDKTQAWIAERLHRAERLISGRMTKLRLQLGFKTKGGLIAWWMTSPDRAAYLAAIEGRGTTIATHRRSA